MRTQHAFLTRVTRREKFDAQYGVHRARKRRAFSHGKLKVVSRQCILNEKLDHWSIFSTFLSHSFTTQLLLSGSRFFCQTALRRNKKHFSSRPVALFHDILLVRVWPFVVTHQRVVLLAAQAGSTQQAIAIEFQIIIWKFSFTSPVLRVRLCSPSRDGLWNQSG